MTWTLLLFSLLPTLFWAQSRGQHDFKVKRSAVVNMSELDEEEDPSPFVTYLGVPDGIAHEHSHLEAVKKASKARFPRKETEAVNRTRSGPPPNVLEAFRGIPGALGIPLDNHLAVSNDGYMVTCANFHIAIYKDSDAPEKVSTLIQFTRPLGLPDFRYDPRVIYDPQEDRFIMTILHGTSRDRSQIIVAFTETNDPTGNWFLYLIDGNPFDQTIFSDYPMLGLTKDHFYFTVNAVDDELSWQEGFVETYIWQIEKLSGYAGASLLPATLITGAEWEGKPIRNLCPITAGDENLQDKQYFISTRNFDIQNDTIFLVELGDSLSSRTLVADVTYGAPPNAEQGTNTLQTNDARILDAFVQEGHVQFVANTIDTTTGLAVIYHGLIDDIDASTTVTGTIISEGDLELGYPDICYAGTARGDRHSIIVTSHVSRSRFPGVSALEFNGTEHSELISLFEGENYITRLGGAFERWGDYSGNQRIYNEPGGCWTVSSFGRNDRNYGIWISKLGRSDVNVSTEDQVIQSDAKVYPNPAREWVSVEFETYTYAPVVVQVVNLQGQVVMDIADFYPKKEGLMKFNFNSLVLPSGSYQIVGRQEGQVIFSKGFIRQ
jgi:hypothetical protein